MMKKVEQVCNWCQEMPSVTVDHAFGPETDVYRVGGRIFALVDPGDGNYVTLKAPPEEVVALRAQYDFVRAGYYMNKEHWVTIDLVPIAPMDEVHELIRQSYLLVSEALPRKRRAELEFG
jgi:predicted DNA-binding protein (MmcQ/YjbR family)